jgi:hypothetical protein
MTHPLRVGIKLSQDAPIESYLTIWKIAGEARFDRQNRAECRASGC